MIATVSATAQCLRRSWKTSSVSLLCSAMDVFAKFANVCRCSSLQGS